MKSIGFWLFGEHNPKQLLLNKSIIRSARLAILGFDTGFPAPATADRHGMITLPRFVITELRLVRFALIDP